VNGAPLNSGDGADAFALTSAASRPRDLLPNHWAQLRKSGLTEATIRTASLYSVTSVDEARTLLEWESGAPPVPALAFPYRGTDFIRLRPDEPRLNHAGKKIKYETPAGKPPRVYIPRFLAPRIDDAAIELWLVKGEKKALAAAQCGFAAVGAPDVYPTDERHEARDQASDKWTLHPDLAVLVRGGRKVTICFDSDIDDDPAVGKAAARLATLMTNAGASVFVTFIPHRDGERVGFDDFLVNLDGDAGELRRVLERARRPADVTLQMEWLRARWSSWAEKEQNRELRRTQFFLKELGVDAERSPQF
jgi:Domain of unknown function (DUF3854)